MTEDTKNDLIAGSVNLLLTNGESISLCELLEVINDFKSVKPTLTDIKITNKACSEAHKAYESFILERGDMIDSIRFQLQSPFRTTVIVPVEIEYQRAVSNYHKCIEACERVIEYSKTFSHIDAREYESLLIEIKYQYTILEQYITIYLENYPDREAVIDDIRTRKRRYYMDEIREMFYSETLKPKKDTKNSTVTQILSNLGIITPKTKK